MHWLPALLVFLIVLFCYIHVIRQRRISTDTNLLEVVLDNRENIDEIMHYRVPTKSYMESLNIVSPSVLLQDDHIGKDTPGVMTLDQSGNVIGDDNEICGHSFMLSPSQTGAIGDFIHNVDSYFSPYSCLHKTFEVIQTGKNTLNTRVMEYTGTRCILFCLTGSAKINMEVPEVNSKNAVSERDSRTNTCYVNHTIDPVLQVNSDKDSLVIVPSRWLFSLDLEPSTTILIAKYRCFSNCLANSIELMEDLWYRYKPSDIKINRTCFQ